VKQSVRKGDVSLQTPLGRVEIDWRDGEVRGIAFGAFAPGPEQTTVVAGEPPDAGCRCLVEELIAYFGGGSGTFRTAPTTDGHTVFQREVWDAARHIPFGWTRSYGQLAKELGRPGSARAVGAALGQNPFPLLIPCHRVVAANGSLTGFAGGLAWKGALLAHERDAASGQTRVF